MMQEGWPVSLAALIDRRRHEPLAWGRHDCLTFANEVHQAITGVPLCADWLGGYSDARGAARRYRAAQASGAVFEGQTPQSTIIEALDSRLVRLASPFPPRGSLVARKGSTAAAVFGAALGVSLGARLAFVGCEGLVFLPPDPADIVWAVG